MQRNTNIPRHPHTHILLSRFLPPLLLILAGVLAYWNSFDGVFLYDDLTSIRDNPHIRTLWPLSEAMSLPLWSTATTVDGRPLLSLSFALNHFLFGPEPWGYHLVNLLIHLVAGLLLFGVVRRTLDLPRFRERCPGNPTWLSLAVALIWLVHPLQTESVTYIVQRAESLMGMLFLLTMYCAIRGFTSDKGGRWYVAAVVACAIGMGVKQTMFSAPLLVILYDYVFTDGLALGERGLQRSGHVARARRARGRFYAGLFATWLIVLGIIGLTWKESTIDFVEISPLRYALTQPLVLLQYLRLAVWPSPLVLSYEWPFTTQWPPIVFPALVILGMLAVMIRGLWRRRWYGFVLAWFLLILAPTSSIAPTRQAMVEHRMYLSLAAVVVLAVIGVSRVVRCVRTVSTRAMARGALAAVVVVVLGALTYARNRDYHSTIGLWQDNVAHRPESQLAHVNLGEALLASGRAREALPHCREALRIDPEYADAHNNLGNALLALKQTREAIRHYRAALRLKPDDADVNYNLGIALEVSGQRGEAIDHYREAVRIKPDLEDAQGNLGDALLRGGHPREAIVHYRDALRLKPDSVGINYNMGVALEAAGEPRQAIARYREAIQLDPNHAEAHINLGNALLAQGQPREGVRHHREAARLKPHSPEVKYNLGIALEAAGKPGEAMDCYRDALRFEPEFAPAHYKLGMTYQKSGRLAEAIRHFEEALRLKPDYTAARDNLRKARKMMKRGMRDEG
jgi:protein O-mannosyl-transferase